MMQNTAVVERAESQVLTHLESCLREVDEISKTISELEDRLNCVLRPKSEKQGVNPKSNLTDSSKEKTLVLLASSINAITEKVTWQIVRLKDVICRLEL